MGESVYVYLSIGALIDQFTGVGISSFKLNAGGPQELYPRAPELYPVLFKLKSMFTHAECSET